MIRLYLNAIYGIITVLNFWEMFVIGERAHP